MSYAPNKGDIVRIRGKRPALILSPLEYNKKTGLAVCCPITSNVKGYPFEVLVSGKKIDGAVLSDHLKNLDWKAREIKFIEKASLSVIAEVIEKISVLIIE
jgi:mRNA interferase MazF